MEEMNYFEFVPPEKGCKIYVIKSENSENINNAIEKFLQWQNKELDIYLRWPEEVVKDKDNWMNWMINLSVIIIE